MNSESTSVPVSNNKLDYDESVTDNGRLAAFSDGVFSVAITLLVLNIQIPHIDPANPRTLATLLLGEWPSYLSYMISFFTIGIVWANHHGTFTHIVRSDHTLRMLNLFLLMTVTLIPFTTALLSQYIQNPDEKRTAAAVYAFVWVLLSFAYNLLWEYAVRNRLADERLSNTTMNSVSRRDLIGLLLYIVAFVVAFFSAEVCVLICLLLAIYYLIPRRVLAINTPKS